MYKSIFDIFNEKQIDLLRAKMWWVADCNKPFLCKFAPDGETALIGISIYMPEITDLRSLWVAKISNKTLQ